MVYDFGREQVALPGSSLYYSVLFAAPTLRAALIALHALVEEFRQVVDESRDENIARAKLGWWAEELQRTCEGRARHPLTQSLTTPLQVANADPARFARVLESMSEHLARNEYHSFTELEAHYRRLADISGCLAAEFCGYQDTATLSAASALGTGLALAELARRPRRGGGPRATDLPAEVLAACGAASADVNAARTGAPLKKAIAMVAQRAATRLRESLEEMPVQDRAAQCNRRALAAIELAQLGAMRRAGFAVLERPRSITPLRKLWIAWKYRL